MTNDELRGHIGDVLAITSLSNQRTVAVVLERVSGTSAKQCLAAALVVAREQARRIAELEHEIGELTEEHERGEDEIADLRAAVASLRARSARTTKANPTKATGAVP